MQAEALTCRFTARLHRKSASFYWSPCPTVKGGSLDLKARVPPKELLNMAGELRCEIRSSKIVFPDIDSYNRLLIYAAVRPTLNIPARIVELAWLVKGLTGWDAHYWASHFRELWWEHRRYRSLLKAVKAFKLLFGLE